jgi:hypothetical protein
MNKNIPLLFYKIKMLDFFVLLISVLYAVNLNEYDIQSLQAYNI